MRIRFRKERVSGSGFRVPGLARWRFAWLGLLLIFGVAPASDELRVISLAPHLTELVYAAGGENQLVGVVDWSDYPPEAAELPSIGDAFRFDLERIMTLSPDLALAWRGGTPVAVVERLDSLGIEVRWIETGTLDQIAEALVEIGLALGTDDHAQAAAAELRTQLARLEPDRKPKRRVFYQVSARPLYTLGGRHVINEVFALCGLENVFADLDVEAAVVDQEAVLTKAPALIIAGSDDSGSTDPLAMWRQTSLVKGGQTSLHQVDPTILIRPTPRIIEGIDLLCQMANSR